MSSENGSEYSNGGGLECRDFLRNVCRRGNRCKFTHRTADLPSQGNTHNAKPSLQNSKTEYKFCHDYQNSKCSRNSCRFVHGSQTDEEYYKSTGELPQHLCLGIQESNNHNDDTSHHVVDLTHGQHLEIPVCKDYLKGECRRGGKCKFRHISVHENKMETYGPPPPTNFLPEPRRRRFEFDEEPYNDINNYNPDFEREFGPPEVKRRHFEPPPAPVCFREIPMANHCYQPPLSHIEARSMMFYDENTLLRKRVDELRKQVSDLTATNEFLLDQNAQLRMSGKRTGIAMPSVTITNAGTSTMQVQPMTAQIQSSSIPTSAQHLVSAAMAGTLRTVTASVATVPVSIATVAGAPVSIATVSMAPVQMQPPIVTMAQTITVDGTHSSQLNGGTASLLSYPIMTHDLRPVLQTSLTH